MPKFQIQLEVRLRVAKTIKADSLEEALEIGRELSHHCPVDKKLVRIGAGVEYLWNEDSVLAGVNEA